MAPRQRPQTDKYDEPEVEIKFTPQSSPLQSTSTIPTILKFPLVVLLTLSINALTNTIAAEILGPNLAPISRTLNAGWQAAAVVAWKALELGVAWFMGFDDKDIVNFTYLTHLPHNYLLGTFYETSWIPLAVYTATTVLANWLPFSLLRRRNPSHIPSPSANPAPITPSSDRTTSWTTHILGSTLYALPLFSSLSTWLPVQLITHFSGIKTLDPAHTANIPQLLFLLFPAGYCARALLFDPVVHPSSLIVPAATMSRLAEEHQQTHVHHTETIEDAAVPGGVGRVTRGFDPETATLYETFIHNLLWWRALHPRARMLLQRTLTLVVWTAMNTWFLGWVVVDGSEGRGALIWASVWAAGAGLSGLVLGWVGGVF